MAILLHFVKKSRSKRFSMHSSTVTEIEVSYDNSDWCWKNVCDSLKGRVRITGQLR